MIMGYRCIFYRCTERDVAAMTIGILQAREDNRRFPRCPRLYHRLNCFPASLSFSSTRCTPNGHVLSLQKASAENAPNATRVFGSIACRQYGRDSCRGPNGNPNSCSVSYYRRMISRIQRNGRSILPFY